ncbi:thioesterase family protein [Thermodesulfitimonas sp.]
MKLVRGLKGTVRAGVRSEDTAIAQGSGTVPVLATPRLLAVMEAAAVAALAGALEEGQTSVGTRVELEHVAATPVGMEVTATAELVGIEGRRLVFVVEARDAVEVIGRGTHERFIVDEARFLSRVAQKKGARENG